MARKFYVVVLLLLLLSIPIYYQWKDISSLLNIQANASAPDSIISGNKSNLLNQSFPWEEDCKNKSFDLFAKSISQEDDKSNPSGYSLKKVDRSFIKIESKPPTSNVRCLSEYIIAAKKQHGVAVNFLKLTTKINDTDYSVYITEYGLYLVKVVQVVDDHRLITILYDQGFDGTVDKATSISVFTEQGPIGEKYYDMEPYQYDSDYNNSIMFIMDFYHLPYSNRNM